MASHPTSRRRKKRAKAKVKYAKAREAAQLMGIIETTPAGAVRDERVDPATQDEQRFPGLDRLAVRNDGKGGWYVPEHTKRKVIEFLAEVLFERKTFIDTDGIERELPPDRFAQVQASKTLLIADKRQWERDNPTEAGKARGAIQVPLAIVNVFDAMAAMPAVEDAVEQIIAKVLAVDDVPAAQPEPSNNRPTPRDRTAGER